MPRIFLEKKRFELNPHYNRVHWSFEVDAVPDNEETLLQMRDEILENQQLRINLTKYIANLRFMDPDFLEDVPILTNLENMLKGIGYN